MCAIDRAIAQYVDFKLERITTVNDPKSTILIISNIGLSTTRYFD